MLDLPLSSAISDEPSGRNGSEPAQSQAGRLVNCPRCSRAAVYAPSNRFRPFCSERCKLSDLGDWASERYRVSGEALSSDDPSQS
ncbi:MAG: DNA gyrase inhibitor YacG [Betaproteobacteria bacterium]|nr:DNA gyrase inhibitor YacG [Pseudomonadota bacterium]NCV57447.1 DNA gyrase inhibitor YacG [Betaproteobacteria bacterium]NCW99059.1 DNA gyrase inhibitor YacG [Betaproteobacteria bacterium]NCX12787.1 DNA gyrase inhibitor YacG [Betaproteobacteria bacterium]NCX44824.1 DNA gyrase inhibitor YacG [Betaproteobacteria bacterium]